MGHCRLKIIFFSFFITACFRYSNACGIEGITLGTPVDGCVRDVDEGTLWRNKTTGATGIDSYSVGGVLDNRGYLSVQLIDSKFELFTTEHFKEYEYYEVSQIMTVTVFFVCPEINHQIPQIISMNVIDTNNNPPTFLPSNEYVFNIAAPMPPGYEITGCVDLIVRDIDLTTQKIIFKIEDNPYFEIEEEIYPNSSTPKEFKAIIRTKTFIRSFPEELKLTIWATDSDRTGDDPRTKEATITFLGNTDFVLPEEPVFSETFYLADYKDDNRVVLTEPITLKSGYDKLVQFNIKGDYSNFELVQDEENKISIRVVERLAEEVLNETNIHLIVTADREFTSGASATVVLRLPEVVPLEFQRSHYKGTIEDNNLGAPQLILSQGYEDTPVNATVFNEYSSYFSANVEGNTITLSMTPLQESIILDNNFLNVKVLATNGRSTATTIVTLEIIKDDNVTPVFNKPIYIGSYSPTGLILEKIELVQGYDEINSVDLHGADDKKYFRAMLNGATVTIEAETIPPEIYSQERIVLTLEVVKPRTVGASATIIVNLPAARVLEFEASTHRGSLQNNALTLDPIRLTVGYDNSVVFTITGDFAKYFQVTNGQNPAIITPKPDIPSDVILNNNVIFLTLVASGLNAVTTTTSVILDVIKDDTTTPVFSSNIYYGTYLDITNFDIQNIHLTQGSDGDVTFKLDGEHAEYFDYSNKGNEIVVFPRSTIPQDVIFDKKVLVFNILAMKALTVGASAAISIRFPSDLTDQVVMGFSQNTYTGTLASNGLAVDDSIKLSAGYAAGTEFILTGEFSKHFKAEPIDDGLTLTLLDTLPVEARERAFIVLEIEATRERAVSAWTSVVIEVVRQEIVPLVFDQAYYRGAYNTESGLRFTQVISLSQGYDDTVSFTLEGAFISLFHLNQRDSNSFVISAVNPIPSDVLQAHSQFLFAVVATKPGALVARSAVSIDIEKDLTDRVVLKFAQSTYTGTLASNGLAIDDSIKLSAGYAAGTEFILTGEFSKHFKAEPIDDGLTLTLLDTLPVEARERAFIVLEIEATRERAVSAWTSVVIEVVRQEIVPLVFDQAYYRGAYNTESGLRFTQVISLSQGYDDTVSFTLEGAFISLFHLNQRDSNSFVISAVNPIPSDVLQAHSQFLFAVVATKPGALVARSAVSIDIEKDLTDRVVLKFAQSTYTGTLASNGLAIDDSIKLSAGYAAGTEFILTGEFSKHFKAEPIDDGLTLTLLDTLPVEARERAFIVLEIEATRERAVSAWTSVVIEVVRQEIVPLVFDQAYYRGAYNTESGLRFTQVISLSQGYDDTVSFTLEGAFISLFHLNQRDSNSFVISAVNPIPSDVLQAHSQFLFAVVATKPGALVARSAVSIDIEKDLTDRVVLKFAQSTYTGTLASNGLAIDDSIKLSAGYAAGTEFILTGEFSKHFKAEPIDDGLTLTLLDTLPVEARERAFIVLEIEATRERAVSAWTSVVIEVVRQEIVPLVFDQAYYRGAYNTESGLRFTQVISLSQGYDDTVSFTLEGAFISLFHLNQRDSNSFVISAVNPIPSDVLQAHSQFLFAVVATKPGALVARSAVSIDIEKDLTDRVVLKFAQSTYTGTLASNGLAIDDSIKLSAGYAAGTEFILTGEFSKHFKAEPIDDGLTLTLLDTLPVEARERAFIVLEIEATRERAVSAWTSVVIEVVRQEIVPLVFDQAYYRGAYNTESGLRFTQVISLSQGYDDTVSFTLEGAFISLFHLNQRDSNSFVISAVNPIPSDVLQAHSQFLFAVVATKPGALVARSAVSIDIEKDLTDRVVLKFAQSTYTGTLASNGLAIDDSIKLSAGYAAGTEFILTGEFSKHFKAEPIDDGLTLTLLDTLPVEARERAFIVLEIEATRERAVSAWTSVVIEVVRQEIVPLVFDQAYYRGAYNTESGLRFTQVISLSQGYDDTVSFTLEGAFISLFHLNQRDSNSFVISAVNPIPSDVLQAHSQFLFAVVATKPGALVARSAVSIDIEKDLTDRVVLKFAQSTYTGTLASNGLAIDDSIKLSAGYAAGTEFILTGEFSKHFKAEPIDDGLTLTLLDTLPVEARERAFIVLEIEATRERAVSAWTSVVIEVVRQEIVPLVFDQAYYRGAYNTESGLRFTQVISLSQGYDDTVSFTLEGAFISLFHLNQRDSNSFVISAVNPIPSDVLQAHSQFLFAVVATKPGALVARSAVSIDIEKDLTDRVVLKFAQSTYTGTLASNGLAIDDSIKLSAGYAAGTEFILTGEFSKHFKAEPIDDGLTLTLLDTLPVEARERAFIVLEIEATRERAVSAWTSVVIEVVRQEIVPLVFDQAYYRGAYNTESGLRFTQVISLSQGYDDTVSFTLEGAFISLFHLNQRDSNSFVISAVNPIPSDVLQAHSQFLFAVVATKPGALVARSAVSIDIEKDLTDRVVLKFAQSTYTGTLASNGLAIDDSIKLSAGYAAGTEFILTGEFSKHFKAEPIDDGLTLTLLDTLPVEARERAFIVLEIEATRERAVSAWTSVVIEVVRQEIVPLVFDQAYYRGAYNTESGLRFTQVISLSQGYDDTVSFTLEGAFISLFHLNQRDSNSFVISAVNPIPSDVLQAHSQFLFAVVATKPGALVARSAVSIDIEKDLTDRVVLKFAQSTYTGTLASNGLAIDDSIKLSAGYAAGTEFILTGEFSKHFKAEPIDDGLTLTLLDTLPVEARERAFIVLEIEATRERAVSAWTSVVIEVVRQEIVPLVFDQAYYRGAYNTESGLRFTQVISLSQGYDDTVSFTLEGAFISLFHLNQRDSNSFVISAVNPIPSDVLQAHSQFLFAVVATKPGALVARSAVSIDIEKDLTDRVVLKFAQSTYTGTLASNGLAIDDSIKLSAGYAAGTEFILTGEFSKHFKAEPIDDGLTLTLLDTLPVEARERAFIVLEIEATRERAVSAWTSVVIEVVRQEIVPLVFDQAYYRGAYNTESGLRFTQVISLSQGYDDTVSFTLEGAFISLFHLNQRDSNSFVISAVNPIPSDVLQAHSQFLFAVVATKPGALVARSAVSIDIEKDLTDRVVLKFAQSTYTGTLASNGLAIDDSIKLSAGYAAGTEFILTGEFSKHFKAEPIDDGLTLTLLDTLPVEARERAFIVLEIEATRERAVSAWTSVVIEVVRQEIVPLVFDQAYYRGAYNTESGLRFTQVISLSQGYDDTVSFTLEGAFISLFHLNQRDSNSFVISAVNPIPSDVLQAHSQFLFAVVATKPGALVARSAVSIDIEKDLTDRVVLKFAQSTYTGTLASNGLAIDDSIKLSAGYAAGTEFILTGEFSKHFKAEPIDDGLTLTLLDTLPVEARERAFIVLEIEATRERAVSAWTSVVIEVVRQEIVPLVFDQAYYRGAYNTESGLRFTQVISLSQGYDDTVSFTLEGAFISLFHLNQRDSNSFVISAVNPIPSDVLQAHSQFLFAVVATKPGALVARSAVSIDIEKDLTDRVVLKFAQSTYTGTLASNGLAIDDSIKLSAGYAAGTEFILTGEFSKHFKAEPIDDGLTLTLLDTLPVEARERAFIVLEIEATRERAVSAWTSVVIEVVRQEIVPLVFDQAYYRGAYNTESGLRFTQVISLSQGYDDTVSFTLEGAFISLFHLNQRDSNSFVISAVNPIPSDVLQAHSQFLFAVVATKPGALVARSAVSIDIEKDLTDRVVLKFAQSTYTGTLASNGLAIDDSIKLSAGYAAGTEFILTGEFSKHFKAEPIDDGLTLTLLDTLPVEARERAFIVLEIEATRERAVSAWTSVVIEVVRQEIVPLVFDQAYYRGAYNTESGLRFTQVISLSQGYDDTVSFTLEGAFISLFHLNQRDSNSFVISAVNPIPSDVLQAHSQFLFAVVATKPGALVARSAISIDIEKGLQVGDDVSFDRVLYRGVLQLDEVRHDVIRVYGYVGTIVDIISVYSNMFEARVSGGRVTVQARGPLTLPADITYLTLELNAANARAVLLLELLESGGTLEPTVTFSSETYRLSVDITQTGFVGRVSASANTGEDLIYSLGTDDAHLQTRLSINNEGELHLSAPANSGLYTFQVIATTVSSEATGTAWVHLTAQAVTVCDDKGFVVPPLIILERDEEAPHSNLVVLDSTQHAGCYFTLTNRWPTTQSWLYVNEFGLHTNAIDREHASIAFMALSQVQVELILHCRSDNDNAIRKKRSKITERLGPYDYGSNKWILTDTIPYNSRRSLVNLIVNDINDNDPIFVGVEHQPIAVGYPTAELEERILPRSLVELQATDADIGENAALRYWSDETVLAVAPTTGFVHVRTGATLTHDQILVVSATDENGQGRTGTIQLIVKLLNLNHIAVVTIRDAFLSDEPTILAQLSNAIRYEVKALRSVVISDDIDVDVTRNKREAGTRGASLQLYVYGIDQREAVTVDRLTADINANAAIAGVVSTIPLEDHLQDMNILDRQIGLLVATIILGVLLFVVILLVAIWFFLRWRKTKNHKELHDESSISNISSHGELPKPETEQPRLNIEDLRRSEKRLQEMLQAPIEQVTVEPMPKISETPVEAILDLPINEPSAPIVIQSIDKLKDAEESSDDEFGEVNTKRRKSVVTFNENVEKIIHVEDNADDDGEDDDASINPSIDASNSGFEIYRL